MNRLQMDTLFEEVSDKVIPLILFSTREEKNKFSDLLSALYDSWYRSDETLFKEIYDKILKDIADRSHYGSHKEILIESFTKRYLSLYDRISNLEKEFVLLKSRTIAYKIPPTLKKKEVQVTKKMIKEIGQNVECPRCGKKWLYTGGKERIRCKKCNARFDINKNNKELEIKIKNEPEIKDKKPPNIKCKKCGYQWHNNTSTDKVRCPKCKKYFPR